MLHDVHDAGANRQKFTIMQEPPGHFTSEGKVTTGTVHGSMIMARIGLEQRQIDDRPGGGARSPDPTCPG